MNNLINIEADTESLINIEADTESLINIEAEIENDLLENDLLEKGFCQVKGSKFKISKTLNREVLNFINAYNNLEIDEYVLSNEGIPYRKRRYGSYTFDAKTKEIIKNKHETFFQSNKLNKVYGGIERNFSPIENKILDNVFLKEIIKENFHSLPSKERNLSNKWFIGIQMFRIETTKDYIGYPSPEGIHQDGHHIVVQHMINKFNIRGGVSLIYDLNKENIASISLEDFLDSCYVKDEMVMHNVSPVTCIDKEEIGTRDMLILDYKIIN